MGEITPALIMMAYTETLRFINNAPEADRAQHYMRLARFGRMLDNVADEIETHITRAKAALQAYEPK